MFEGIGLAPVSIALDLDSYDGPWTHVERFRRSSGWLTAVRATIQSEHDILSANLIAACDDRGNAIESWRATHLTHCDWSDLAECDEHPPEMLDDLLCEEEGALYARWQREMNADLTLLFEQAQRGIEMLEARSSARARIVESQIADLRRRRRMPDCPLEAQIALGAVIVDLEAENDRTVVELTERRARLRREADAAEEVLWQRTDVLIEVEPRFIVRWRASDVSEISLLPEFIVRSCSLRPTYVRESSPSHVWLRRYRKEEGLRQKRDAAAFGDRQKTNNGVNGANAILREIAVALEVSAAKATARREIDRQAVAETCTTEKYQTSLTPADKMAGIPAPASNFHPSKAVTNPSPNREAKTRDSVLSRRGKLEARAERLRSALALPGSHPNWRMTTEGNLDRLERNIADIDDQLALLEDCVVKVPSREKETVAVGAGLKARAQVGAADLERAMLVALLEDLTDKSSKFLPGSPKTQRNLDERAEVQRQIATLDKCLSRAGGGCSDDQRNWSPIEVDALRSLWTDGKTAAEIARTIGRVSRNAVIAKAKRLGLPIREQASHLPRQAGEDNLTGSA